MRFWLPAAAMPSQRPATENTEQLWLSAVCVSTEYLWLSAVYVHWAAVTFCSMCPLSSCDFLQRVSTNQLWLSAVCVHWAAVTFSSLCPLSGCDVLQFVSTKQPWFPAVCVHWAAMTFCSVSTKQLWLSAVYVHWAAVTFVIYLHHMLKLLKCFTAYWIQYHQGDIEAERSDECIACALLVRVRLYSMVISSGKQLCGSLGLEENILSHSCLCIYGWSEYVSRKPFGLLRIPWYCDKAITGDIEAWNFVVTACLELWWKSCWKPEAPLSG
jgi:hypothetical protein